MLALSKRIDYGLIALCHLANHRDRLATAREIAAEYHVPQALLMNILKQLAQSGLARSMRGPHGGYELGRDPESMTLCEIVEAIEGPLRFVQCVAPDDSALASKNSDSCSAAPPRCELADGCPVSAPMFRLHRRLKGFLSEMTLAEIAFDPSYGRPPTGGRIGLMVAGREIAI